MDEFYYVFLEEPPFVGMSELDLALSELDGDNNERAEGVVYDFIIRELYDKGYEEFTEKDIADRFNELFYDYILSKLVENGDLDVLIGEDGKAYYTAKDQEE